MRQAAELERFGRQAEAEAVYRQIINADQCFHPAYHALGLLAFNNGNLSLAADLLKAAIAIDKKNALYQRNYGEMCRRLGRLPEAIAAGKAACKLTPTDIDAHYNLGLAYTDAKDYSHAITAYRRALKLNPNHGLSWNNLGSALEQQGNKDAALDAYNKAVTINPHHAEAQNNAGAIFSEQGKLDEARACFQAAIDARPDFVEAHYNLSSLKTYQQDDPHLAILEGVYANRATLSDHARIRYCFALGKALEDTRQYDRAFAAYDEGNRLQHALLPMDERMADRMLESIVRVFDEKFFAERSAWQVSPDPKRTPVFIVGMPRSGTTLLEQILCSHGSVHGAGELMDLNEVVSQATGASPGKPFMVGVQKLSQADMRRIGDDYLERVWKLSPDSAFITDKMPANFFYLGLIHLALPHAKIIHAMRDPMDSCFSCFSRLFNDTMEFAYDQGTLGRYYRRYMTLMRHWHKVLPAGRILDLRYEDMVADTEGQARRVLEFVGLPWDENCLNFHQNQRLVKTASVAQVRQPIYKTSVARWKHFARHLRPLYELVKYDRADDGAEALFAGFPTEKAGAGGAVVAVTLAALPSLRAIRPAPVRTRPVSAQMPAQAATGLPRQALPEQTVTTLPEAHRLHQEGISAWQAGQREEALQLIGAAIDRDGSVALFHSNLAEMSRQLGRLDAAISHGERGVALDPSMASAHSNLGIAYYDAKRHDEAEACHQKALALTPGLLQSLNNLGSIARARKNLKAAAEWYRKALAIDSDYLESLSNLGAVLVEDDQADAAEASLLRALQLQPAYPEALCNLGLARLKQERTDEAAALLQRSLQLRPGYSEALVGLARARHEKDQLDDAAQLLRQATQCAPDKTDAWCQLGSVCMELGETVEAEAAFTKAIAIDPEASDALTGLANLRLEEGKIEVSVRLLDQALSIDPESLSARFHLTQARKVKPGDANLAALEARATDMTDLNTDKRISLHYALGKAYDDLKDYDRAFPHFLEGARLKRQKLHYDAGADAARVQCIVEIVDRTFLDRLWGAGDPSDVPVFVLGMPRSGTTLTEQIIASHPEVHGAGELRDLMEVVQQPISGFGFEPYPEGLAKLDRQTVAQWGRDYAERLRRHAPQAKRITDKMPANYLALGLIPLILPNAKIIHVKRNPVDTCVSCFTRLFNRHQDATYDLAELGRHYASYARLMQHWRQVLPPGSFMEVQYEDIVADMEGQARRLIDFVGLEWNDACLEFHKNARNIRTASVTQVRQPIYTSSVERWRHYEKHLGALLQALEGLAP